MGLRRTILRRLGMDAYELMEMVSRKESSIAHLFGILFFYLAIAFVFPLIVAVWYGDPQRPWLFCILLTSILGAALLIRYRSPEYTRPTEALFVVSFAWLVVMLIGAIPYMLAGMDPLDALFEAMSGFTTTGSTIMTDIESWSRSLLFWRSFTQWLGGAGIIMIFVTIFPMLGVGGRNLFKNEFPGLDVQNFSLRIQEEARKFHYIFIILSGTMILLLLLTGIGMYESLVLMFSTMPTGGFSPHSGSIAFYDDPVVEWIVIIFMFLAGTNFYLHFKAFSGRRPWIYKDSEEFRIFLFLGAASSLVVAIVLLTDDVYGSLETIRVATFHVISLLTSTGFATRDYLLWDPGLVFLLFVLIMVGASTGSTAGGLKSARALMSGKFLYAVLYKLVHPRAIFSTKLDGRAMNEETITSVVAVVMAYFVTMLVTSVAMMLTGLEPTTALGAAVTTLSNAGPGIGELGPYGSFGEVPGVTKVILIFNMWAGRLELLSVFVVLTPVFWRELLRYRESGR